MAIVRHLRKGHSSVHLMFERSTDTIGAKLFQAEMDGETAVLRFTLHPVDGNQRMDEEHLASDTLQEVQINDNYVIDGLSDFLQHRQQLVKAMRLEIVTKGRTLRFNAVPGNSAIAMLPIKVTPIAN